MDTPTIDLYRGDCLATLRNLPDNSVDSIVTDPPYGLSNTDPAKVQKALTAWVMGARDYVPEGKGFMGQAWDSFVPPPAVWDECYRVLKPGGHMAVFAGSRTQDLMGMSIRLAGFDLRDSVAWLYGSGFPKSLDVSKAIDAKLLTGKSNSRGLKKANAQRPDAGPSRWADKNSGSGTTFGRGAAIAQGYKTEATAAYTGDERTTSAATDEAKKWEGWGTALKPAHEPIILARKPFPGTVAANVQEHGTGALNIDATRTGLGGEKPPTGSVPGSSSSIMGQVATSKGNGGNSTPPAGRWPANVILDEDQAAALDEQSGVLKTQKTRKNPNREAEGGMFGLTSGGKRSNPGAGETGGASRFFYVAKAGKKERPSYVDENGDTVAHPTVKPVALIQWLVRLITPPGGTVLEPFAGTGTTGEAAALEGFACIMIERHEPYLPLIRARMDAMVERIK